MRRIKVILAVVATVATMMVLAAPAMAQVVGSCDENGLCSYWNPNMGTFSPEVDECWWVWSPSWEDWFLVCELD